MKRTLLKKHGIYYICIVTGLLFTLTSCGKADASSGLTEETEPNIVPSLNYTEVIPASAETEPNLIGDYTLDEAKISTGSSPIFIAHEDGSFSQYIGTGYLDKNTAGNSEGMFLRNSVSEYNPQISKNDKLVLFCDSDYTLSLLPVKWQAGAIATENGNGKTIYIRALNYDKSSVDFYIYGNGDISRWNVMYMDGIPVEDYPFEVVGENKRTLPSCSLPYGATINFGLVDGTTLVEVPYTVNATYYNCQVTRNSGLSSKEQHHLYPTPTLDGYAIIDIYDGFHDVEIDSGLYVMELQTGNRYYAYLLNWENT